MRSRRISRSLLWIFASHGSKSADVRPSAIGQQSVLSIGLIDQPRREQDFLAEPVHVVVVCPWTAARFGVAQRLGLPTHRGQRFDGPALVRPDLITAEQVDDLLVTLRSVESAQASGRAVKVASRVLIRAERQASDADKPVGPNRRKLLRSAELSPMVGKSFDIWHLVGLV